MGLESEIDVRLYSTPDGRTPFSEWLELLTDWTTQQRVDARLGRIRGGNLGDHKHLGGGLYELRLDFGPGYRIYFAKLGLRVVILVGGGEKRSQDQDIRKAREYLQDLRERNP
jgi:putative addiction module killer protein